MRTTDKAIRLAGIKTSRRPEDFRLFLSVMAELFDIYEDELKKLDSLFIFRMSEQANKYTVAHALQFLMREDGKPFYSVGISKEALEMGVDFSAGIISHELSHTLNGDNTSDHDERFKRICSGLIERYENRTRKKLPWDFTGPTLIEKE